MKKLYIVFVILSVLFFTATSNNSFAQTWTAQSSGTTSTLYSVSFTSASIGNVVGGIDNTEGTILRTTDGGTTWTKQVIGTEELKGVSFTDANNGTAVGRGGKIYRTINGGTNWTAQTSGTTNDLFSVSFTDANTGTVVGANSIILRTTNGGTNWTAQTSPTSTYMNGVFFTDSNNGTAVGAWAAATIFRTTNGGTTWTQQTSPITNTLQGVSFTDANTGTIVGGGGKILRTTDGGANWTEQTSGTTNDLLGVFCTDANNVTAVGSGTRHISRTIDGGANWTLQSFSGPTRLWGVSFTDANTGFAVGDNGTILKTLDGALPVELISFTAMIVKDKVELIWQTATEVNNYGFEVERASSPTSPSQVWTKIGFLQGHGNSNSPKEYSFTDQPTGSKSFSYRLKQIDFDGAFEYSEVVTINVEAPNALVLEQNYPNPFNPTSTIRYEIPQKGFVKISVYDILGKEIKVLVNEEKNPGHYEIIFDARELSSGIYFYTIKAADFTQSKKMILMK